jgi:hypothetical protein
VSIAPQQERPLTNQELQDRCALLEARSETYFKMFVESEARSHRYARVLRVFGVFYSACLAHNFKDKRPVLTRRAPLGLLFGLKDRLTLTADDFRMAGYVLHEGDPTPSGDVDEMARAFQEDGRAYAERHPEQRDPRLWTTL